MRKISGGVRYGVMLCLCFALAGCSGAYYKAMESVGVHKRDILVDRVGDARDSQEKAKEEFGSALERFSHVLDFDGGTLQDKYEELDAVYGDCESRAESVRDRIDSVEDVAQALFDEWEQELDMYSSAKLRRKSAQRLVETRRQYEGLIRAMRRAEKSMEPVLATLGDQVLYLKHNLNARAISSLKGELRGVRQDVASLVRDMERSIAEADQFISVILED